MCANEDITSELEQKLRAHASELHRGLDPALAATVIVLDAIAHKSVPERYTPLAAETAADEGYALVMSYLTLGDAYRSSRRRAS